MTEQELEEMKQEDEGIARVLRLKREEERQRKEDKRELLHYKNRILSLLTALAQNKQDSAVIFPLVTELVDVNQNTDVGSGRACEA